MITLIYNIDELNQEIYNKIGEIVRNGGLVVFPTETVYGIGANALDKEAAHKIYEVKGRPSDNPLIVHIDDINDLKKYTTDISDDAKKLINTFWPGPLTLIFNKSQIIPDHITGGLNTVAIRKPNSEIALNLIKFSKRPICAPSANISGRPSSTLFTHVYEDLNLKVDVIINGGKSPIGLESTVLDLTTHIPTILRPGAITKEMIESTLNKKVLDATSIEIRQEVPKSPGMKYTHYSPKGKITVISGEQNKIINYINKKVVELKHKKVAVICVNEFEKDIVCDNKVLIGSLNNSNEIASNLFISLRKMDELAIEEIFIHALPTENIGSATMNRLLKAAGYNIINLN